MTSVAVSNWGRLLPAVPVQAWLAEVREIAAQAEPLRCAADYDTGSILESEAYMLRAITESVRAHVVIEVGTFIGTSTCSLASAPCVDRVYTCDVSNDCLPATNRVHTYPHQTSTQMLEDVVRLGVRADLCFFDGCVNAEDVPLLAKVTTPETVYAVHDYNYGPKIRKNGARETVPRKGIGNIQLLQPYLRNHVIVPPQDGQLIAALVPRSLL